MSKLLIKILDKSILPAASLVVFKVLGMYLMIKFLNLNWFVKSFSSAESFFSVRFVFDNPESALTVNTFSNALMYFVVLFVCITIIIRAYYFHSSHQSPRIISRLANVNLLGIISDSKDIFTDAFVWFTGLWIATIICIYGGLSDTSQFWIAPVTFILSLVASAILVSDIEHEIVVKDHKNLA